MSRISTINIWITPSHDYELNGTCNICFSIKTSTLSLFAATANLHFFCTNEGCISLAPIFSQRSNGILPWKIKLIPWGQNNFKLQLGNDDNNDDGWKRVHIFPGKLPPPQKKTTKEMHTESGGSFLPHKHHMWTFRSGICTFCAIAAHCRQPGKAKLAGNTWRNPPISCSLRQHD